MPSAFTLATGRDHWEVLLRARAIENQVFVLAPNQIGEAPPHYDSYGHSAIVDPWGVVLADRPRRGVLRRRRPRPRRAGAGPRVAALARQPPARGLRLAPARWRRAPDGRKAPPIDKRRQILDAAIRVFARQGFHSTRVSDIADEAGVAYGLVYHYFNSKDEVLNELFIERWSLLLAAIEEADRAGRAPREKLAAVAGFIVDSYRHDPELMKVIIVEVTRAANSFGRTHLPEIRRAYDSIAKIVAEGQEAGAFRRDIDPDVRLDVLLRGDRAAALGLDLRGDPGLRHRLRRRQGACGRDDLRRPRAAIGIVPIRRGKAGYGQRASSNDWSGAGCWPPAARSPASSPRGSRPSSGAGSSTRTRPSRTTDARAAQNPPPIPPPGPPPPPRRARSPSSSSTSPRTPRP